MGCKLRNREVRLEQQEAVRQERRGILSRLPFRPSDDGDLSRDSLDQLVKLVKARNSKIDPKEIQRAYAFAAAAHEGQRRLSGEEIGRASCRERV